MNFYDLKATLQNGEEVSMGNYKGKLLLVVNTATGCGFTPQYKELEALYEDFKDKGFEILDFPCNQFAGQTPGNDEEIHEFCTLKYNVSFPQFKKSDVNGENANEVFKWLTANSEFKGFGKNPMAMLLKPIVKKMDPDYKNNGNIKWNFTKFLISTEGSLIQRYEPTEGVDDLRKKVEELL
ncbi:MAG: glutathione peroxidase [Lachnospiraceae bacterium]|nr:glutathione peroxidase [Lachnospiraceae bacterium]